MTETPESGHDVAPKLLSEFRDDFRRYLEYMKSLGFRGLALSESAHTVLNGWGTQNGSETLEAIRKDLGDCRRCKLESKRKHIVFGAGDPKAKLVLVGEAPGYEEDLQGLPFVGRAGRLLTDMLRAIQLDRSEVYICNVLKCRPPGNRDPEADEISACIPFLRRQIRAIRPRLICTLGAFAARTLLEVNQSISALRGRFYTYEGIPLIATYHPAFLLRNVARKRQAWEDLQKVQEAYEKP